MQLQLFSSPVNSSLCLVNTVCNIGLVSVNHILVRFGGGKRRIFEKRNTILARNFFIFYFT